MSKCKLYVDLDNVVIPTNEIMPKLYEELTGIKPKSYTTKSWNCKDVFDNPDKEILHKIFEMPRFFELATPYKRCLHTLYNLSKYYNVCFVSVGSKANLDLKSDWLSEVIPFIPEENYMLLEQVGKANSIDKSCCEDGVIIDDNISALVSTKNCLRILYQPQQGLDWQIGYEDLLAKDEIHKVVTEWNEELENYLIGYSSFLERWE